MTSFESPSILGNAAVRTPGGGEYLVCTPEFSCVAAILGLALRASDEDLAQAARLADAAAAVITHKRAGHQEHGFGEISGDLRFPEPEQSLRLGRLLHGRYGGLYLALFAAPDARDVATAEAPASSDTH